MSTHESAMENIQVLYYLRLDPHNALEEVDKIVAIIRPEWSASNLTKRSFSEGFLNTMLCVHEKQDVDKQEALVVRVFRDASKPKPDKQFQAMQLAVAAGCLPSIVSVFQNGVVYRYAPGRTLTANDLNNPCIIRATTRKLAVLHTLDVKNIPIIDQRGHPATFDDTCNYGGWIKKWTSEIPAYLESEPENEIYQKYGFKADELCREYDSMAATLREIGVPTGLTHGDIFLRNMVYDEGNDEMHLIDYDTCEMGPTGRDLVNVFAFRPFLEMAGVMSPEEPKLTSSSEDLWVRSYVEERWRLAGRDPTRLPGVLVDLAWAELNIQVTYQYLLLTAMGQIHFTRRKCITRDHICGLQSVRREWNLRKLGLEAQKNKYLELKAKCRTLNIVLN